MELKQSGSQPSGKGPDDWFTGTVRIDLLFAATEPSRVSAALVTFEPGARSAWHTYAIEQPDDVDINEILFRPTAGTVKAARRGLHSLPARRFA